MNKDEGPPGIRLADTVLLEPASRHKSKGRGEVGKPYLSGPATDRAGQPPGTDPSKRVPRWQAHTSHQAVERASAPSESDPRRKEPRFRAAEDRIWMQWWSEGEFNGLAARLINVSRHGAMLVSALALPVGQKLRIFLEEPLPDIGVDSIILASIQGQQGLHQLRLEFIGECPESFFAAAASGFEAWLAGERSKL